MSQKRVTFSLPEELANEIDFVCHKAGVNRSALISEIVKGPIGELLHHFGPDVPVEEYVHELRRQRRRGSSDAAVKGRIRLLSYMLHGGSPDDSTAH